MSGVPTEVDAVVWVADGLVADGLDYGSRLVERLARRGLRVVRRDLPSAADDAAPTARLHVLSGGATSVNERSGWMPRGLALTRSLVEAARRDEHTLVGVCLGAQMVAAALWPDGVRPAGQIEVGLTRIQWRDRQGECSIVPAFHVEELDHSKVVSGGGQVMAANAHSPVQGFRFGVRVWGLQFHPELEPDDVRRVAVHHRQVIEACGGTADAALRSVDQLETHWTGDLFDRVFDRVLER